VWAAGTPDERRKPFDAFRGKAREALLDAGFANELAVVDPAAGEIRVGVDGVLWWLEETRLRSLARLASAAPIRSVLAATYRFVARNRRFIAPPSTPAGACACEPDRDPARQGAFAVLTLATALALAACYGWTLAQRGRVVEPVYAVAGMVVLSFLTWFVATIGFGELPGWSRRERMAHAAAGLVAGTWILAPVSLLMPYLNRLVPVAAFIVAAWLTARSYSRRAEYLGGGDA